VTTREELAITTLSLTPLALAYGGAVLIVCYALRGSTGFGAAVAMPLLGIVIPIKILVPAWTLISLGAGFTLLGQDRKHVAWRDMARLVPGCIAGVLIGLYIFKTVDARTLTVVLGVAVLLYGLYSLWTTTRPKPKPDMPPALAGHIFGVLGGILGTVIGTMASVFFAIYFDVIRMGKEHFRATMTAILVTIGLTRGLGYYVVGEFTRDVLFVVALAVPPMLIGIFIGNRIHTGLSELAFRRIISFALIASGLALLWK
jgi:uncharacterized membrane protein YfcA